MVEFRPLELHFEEHFCDKLKEQGYRKRENGDFDLDNYFDFKIIEEFLESTQKEELKEIKEEYGDRWKKEFVQRLSKALETKKIFEILKEGIEISNQKLKLIYFKPETTFNKEQLKKYKANIFSYIRQFRFIDDEKLDSIDIVLYLNGLPITTIELKSQLNEQVAEDAVSQYVNRDKKYKIFKTPFLHIACDTAKAKIASEFLQNSADDFAWFNKELENPTIDNEFRTEYLYNEILTPESIIEIIEHYLFCFEKILNEKKVRTFLFPRYHQRRTVLKLTEDVRKNFQKNKNLDLKYLIQHSAGSGKSYTIAVIQKFFRYLHAENKPIFDSIVILTDRINLDGQIKGTVQSGETQADIVSYVEDTAGLAKALNQNKKVIITTIQKFSVKKLDELAKKQKERRICIIIDEAHRSQAGKLHTNMLGKLEPTEISLDEEISEELQKKKFPNLCFIALTATPSEKTLQTFGKPFDIYSMEQAEKEGYILPVSESIVTYQTFYELSSKIESNNEYPPLLVIKKLKNKAYEDDKIIKNKIDIILSVFKTKTENAIKNDHAKAMIVTSSRKAAVKYKKLLDEEIKKRKLNYRSLVAFTGSVPMKEGDEDKTYTENSMNGKLEKKIEDEFNKKDFRFIIVANKFQTGFNQPLLHTMFLDKSLSGINAVQTISRLNRTFPSKMDTLVVDFTNSYKEIIKAFRKFKGNVEDFSDIDITDLPRLKKEILDYNIFTNKDVEDFRNAFANADQKIIDNIFSRIEESLNKKYKEPEKRLIRSKLNKFSKLFNYLDNLVTLQDQSMKNLSRFVYYLSRYLNPLGTGKKIDEELKKVFLIRHKIKEVKQNSLINNLAKMISAKKEINYATIQEVIEAINLQYKLALTEGEENAIKNYMDEISKDPEIIRDIRANLNKDIDRFFELSLKSKLYERFIDYFMRYNIDKVTYYIEKGLESFINKAVFAMMVDKAKNVGGSEGLEFVL